MFKVAMTLVCLGFPGAPTDCSTSTEDNGVRYETIAECKEKNQQVINKTLKLVKVPVFIVSTCEKATTE